MTVAHDWEAFLRQAPPRTVPSAVGALVLRGGKKRIVGFLFLTGICLIVAAAFFPWSIVDDIRLDFGGVAGRGVVTESVYANRTLGDDTVVAKRLVFQVRFRFRDGEAREREAASLFFGHLPPGTEVDIEYLPSDPTLARLRDGFFVPGGLWEVAWSAMFVALPVFGAWNHRRWRRRRLALLIHGLHVPGRIERVWSDDPSDETRGWVELSYAAPGHPMRHTRTVEGEAYRRARAIAEAQQPVNVLHAPGTPREHVVLELV